MFLDHTFEIVFEVLRSQTKTMLQYEITLFTIFHYVLNCIRINIFKLSKINLTLYFTLEMIDLLLQSSRISTIIFY